MQSAFSYSVTEPGTVSPFNYTDDFTVIIAYNLANRFEPYASKMFLRDFCMKSMLFSTAKVSITLIPHTVKCKANIHPDSSSVSFVGVRLKKKTICFFLSNTYQPQGEGKVFKGVCPQSTLWLLLVFVTTRSVSILLECFLVN